MKVERQQWVDTVQPAWTWVVSGAIQLGSVGAWTAILSLATVTGIAPVMRAEGQPLFVAYPPADHETTSDQIFLIGTAPADGQVLVNGEPIERSATGNFAPSFPLDLGLNTFTVRYQDQELTLRVNRLSTAPPVPEGLAFAEGTLLPAVDLARQPGELVCFEAIAPPAATVSVSLAGQNTTLVPQPAAADLPPNSAVLTLTNQPAPSTAETYQGCSSFTTVGNLGTPLYTLTLNGQTVQQAAPGTVEILSPTSFQVAEVTAASGTARTGPSTDYSRLTPLPTGTLASVIGRDGEWYRLDYGAWIRASDVQVSQRPTRPHSLIRSARAEQLSDRTEVTFPLQLPVPISVEQSDRTFTLTLYNTTAQTDTILFNDDPLVERMDWTQPVAGQVRYTFHLKTDQQWGYDLRYEGTSLILTLRHPPDLGCRRSGQACGALPLNGASIVLDPGHGGEDDLGARGPNGYPEKDVALTVSKLIRDRLVERGATVYMTRESDEDVGLQDRVDLINQLEPTVALSIHYNALPDNGDAINTSGVGTFWYNPQAHSLSIFLHNYLTETLDRPSYGVFWNNLALTRPTIAPSVLLELGFMINPEEFEWVINPNEQEQLAEAIAEGVTQWLIQETAERERDR